MLAPRPGDSRTIRDRIQRFHPGAIVASDRVELSETDDNSPAGGSTRPPRTCRVTTPD